jgi:hypothetical protein
MSDPRRPIDDPDAPPSEEELAASSALRDALDDPSAKGAEVELARSLRSAWSPRDIDPAQHAAIVKEALARHEATRRRRATVVRVSFGASAVVALAAGVLLFVSSGRAPPSFGPLPSSDMSRSYAAVAVSRSTQPLFQDRFAARGGESGRIDRIAMARASDLRDNEFAKWGVR